MGYATYSPFRLGDVRGLYPEEIDEAFAMRFARAFADHFRLNGKVATGRDTRESSVALQQALNAGFREGGLDVLDLGLCTTELGYFASVREDIVASIVVTASHNPLAYNGFKCSLSDGQAVTYETGLSAVRERMHNDLSPPASLMGGIETQDLHPDYVDFLASKFPADRLSRRRVAINGLNGTAATVAAPLASRLDLPVTWFRKQPGPIPTEGADPTNSRLLDEMKSLMDGGNFDLGVAWDGDADRCVFFDPAGDLIPTYYIIGLLADAYLREKPGASIVFDTKLCWNTLEIIERHKGVAVPSETGHAFMKRKMRHHKAVYGGELSSHHYFADFYYCDSGMFAWLKVLEVLETTGRNLTEILQERRDRFCITPEITLRLDNADRAFEEILDCYGKDARVDHFDGLSFDLESWRFSLRRSKTEPVVRLNLESRGGPDLLLESGHKLMRHLQPFLIDDEDWSDLLYSQ